MRFYNYFPRELGQYRQWTARTLDDIVRKVNRWNGKLDLYTSVYAFPEWRGRRPNYNSAIIDRIYWDIDPYYTDKGTGEKVYIGDIDKRALAMSDKLMDDGIPHWLVASGSGINIYGVTTEYPPPPDSKKNILYAIQNHYDDPVIQSDQLHGDVARISRIPNTRNMKFRVNEARYCVFVSREDIETGEYIRRMEECDNNYNGFVPGDNPIDLMYWEQEAPERYTDIGFDMYDPDEDIDPDDVEEFSTDWYCVQQSFERCQEKNKINGVGTNRDRFIVLTHMFNVAISSEEAEIITQREWDPRVYNAMKQEGQLRNIYKNGVMFPSRDTLKQEGRCNDCDRC